MSHMDPNNVWKYFQVRDIPGFAQCIYCAELYSVEHTRKMKKHLAKCLKDLVVFTPTKSDKEQSQTIAPINTSVNSRLQISDTLNFQAISDLINEINAEKSLNQLLAKAIFVTDTPVTIVDHPLFVQAVKELKPSHKLPSSKEICNTHLTSVFQQIKSEINEVIKSADNLHLLCQDTRNQRGDIIINIFIMKPEAVFVKTILDSPNSDTAKNLSQEILNIINQYGAQKFTTLLGKGTKNFREAFQLVKNKHGHLIPLQCVADTLYQISEKCFKFAKENKIKISSLIPQTKDNLINTERKNEFFWLYTERCKNQLSTIIEKITDTDNKNFKMCNFYKLIKDVRSELNSIIPDLRYHLWGITSDIEYHADNFFVKNISLKTENSIKPIHLATYMLDPKTQGTELNEDEELQAIEFICKLGNFLNIDALPDLANYRAKEGFWSKTFLWKSIENVCPLAWWKGLCGSRPLSKIAVRLLTAPCTSVVGDSMLNSPIRAGTNKEETKTASKIYFVKHNWNLLNEQGSQNITEEH